MWTCDECGYQNSSMNNTCGECNAGRLPHHYIGEQIGKWVIEAPLGEGGMAFVMLARHVELKSPVAIKLLRSDVPQRRELIERFRTEALAASRLKHENVIEVLDFGSQKGIGVYMVLEYLKGEDLEEKIAKDAPMHLPMIMNIAHQICRGLSTAHDENIIHRDLKPSNIFLIPRKDDVYPLVKLLDFGIAKIKEAEMQGDDEHKLTKTGTVLGTPMYLSPEQLTSKNSDDLSQSVDIYAFGVILYQMIVGRAPVQADTFPQLVAQIMFQTPPLAGEYIPDLKGTALELFLHRMMSKKPEDRPESMMHAWEELKQAASTLHNHEEDHQLRAAWESQLPQPLATGEMVHPGTGQRPAPDQFGDTIVSEFTPPPPKRNWFVILIISFFIGGLGIFGYSKFLTPPPKKIKPIKRVKKAPLTGVPRIQKQALSAYQSKDYSKAIKLWRIMMASKKWKKGSKVYKPTLYKKIGYALNQKKQVYGAVLFYERYLQNTTLSKKEKETTRADLAVLKSELGKRKKAAGTLFSQLLILIKQKNYKTAWDAFTELFKIDRSLPDPYIKAARSLKSLLPSQSLRLYKTVLKLDMSSKRKEEITKEYELFRKSYLGSRKALLATLREHIANKKTRRAKKTLQKLLASRPDDGDLYTTLNGLLQKVYLLSPKLGYSLLKLYESHQLSLRKKALWTWLQKILRKKTYTKKELKALIDTAKKARRPLLYFNRAEKLLSKGRLRQSHRIFARLEPQLNKLTQLESPLQKALKKKHDLVKKHINNLPKAQKLWKTFRKQARKCQLQSVVKQFKTEFLPLLHNEPAEKAFTETFRKWLVRCGGKVDGYYQSAMRNLKKGLLKRALYSFRQLPGLIHAALARESASQDPKVKEKLQQQLTSVKGWVQKLEKATKILKKLNKLFPTCQEQEVDQKFADLMPLLKDSGGAEVYYQRLAKQWKHRFSLGLRAKNKALKLYAKHKCQTKDRYYQTKQEFDIFLRLCPKTPQKKWVSKKIDDCQCRSGLPWVPCSKRQ